jgi:hypothetical protein
MIVQQSYGESSLALEWATRVSIIWEFFFDSEAVVYKYKIHKPQGLAKTPQNHANLLTIAVPTMPFIFAKFIVQGV